MEIVLGILAIAIPILSGTLFTYVYESECALGWRVASGTAIGVAAFSLVVYLVACKAGLTDTTLALDLTIAALPLLLLRNASIRENVKGDIAAAKAGIDNFFAGKGTRFQLGATIYAVITGIFLIFFFSRAIYINKVGIFTGDVSNCGDLSFHLGIITSFFEGNNFPAQHPEAFGEHLAYHFLFDLYSAVLLRGGFGLSTCIVVPDVIMVFAMLAVLHRFAWVMTRDIGAAMIAPAITLLSGGLGFDILAQNARATDNGFLRLIWHPIQNYTIEVAQEPMIQMGNMLTTQFMTQRAFLLGVPILLTGCIMLHQVIQAHSDAPRSYTRNRIISLGLIAGIMPFAHIACFAALMGIAFFAMLACVKRPGTLIDFAIMYAIAFILAIPAVAWLAHDSHALGLKSGTFHPSVHLGWMANQDFVQYSSFNSFIVALKHSGPSIKNWVVFWLRNCGPYIPLLICALCLSEVRNRVPKATLILTIPLVLCFVAANIFQVAPWIWDNTKMLLVWFVGCAPLVALVLTSSSTMGSKGGGTLIAVVLGLALVLSGFLDVWRVTRLANPSQILSSYDFQMAKAIKENVPIGDPILCNPTCFTPVILTGRLMVEGFKGTLWSQGFDADQLDNDLHTMYAGGPQSAATMKKYGVRYAIVGPNEGSTMPVDYQYFQKFRAVAKAGYETLYDTQTLADSKS